MNALSPISTGAARKPAALFLDRDGTINVDHGYVYRREDFEFIGGIFELCALAQELGYLIIVITNQSGIARGYYSEQAYEEITRHMVREFAERGVSIAAVIHCPEMAGENRKPNPGMFMQAQQRFQLDMAASFSLGDKERDLEAARRAGVERNFLFRGDYSELMQELRKHPRTTL